jgi:hypothetical protein
MTRWGALLLVGYVGLALSRWGGTNKAMRWAVGMTAFVIVIVVVSDGTL